MVAAPDAAAVARGGTIRLASIPRKLRAARRRPAGRMRPSGATVRALRTACVLVCRRTRGSRSPDDRIRIK